MINRKFRILIGTTSALALATPAVAQAQETEIAETGESDEIVVSAIRQSLESAQAIKRNSDDIVDSIVAEDIGKLPDVTASESLARITGVSVERNAGIAQAVRVRGLPDLTTTYNGREVFTAEGRAVALQDFPSNSVARLDVYKAASANLVEPGLAGLIDVRSRRPLDFKGTRIAGAVTGLHWYQSQRLGLEANLLASTRWSTGIGDMGFLIEGSYADTKFMDSARVVSQTILNRRDVPGYVGTDIRLPSFHNTAYSNGTRYRPNAAAAFQWQPSASLEFYLDGLYQGYRADNEARSFLVNSGAAAVLSNVELFEGTNQIASVDAIAGGQSTAQQQVNDQATDTLQAGGGFIWELDTLNVTGDVAYTDSKFTNTTANMNYTSRTQPARHFEFDTDEGVGGGTVTISNFDLFDPASYRWTNIVENGNRGTGQGIQARLDFDQRVDRFGLTNIQAGVRFTDRDAESFNFTRTDVAPAGQFLNLLPLEYVNAPVGFRGDEANSLRTWLSPTRDSLEDNLDFLRELAGQPAGRPEWTRVYTSNEKSYSAYLQARYEVYLGEIPIDGLVGARATRTENLIEGLRATEGAGAEEPVTRENAYTDFLPNVSTRIRFLPELQLRLAFTKTRTRPGFGDLNPSINIGAPPPICIPDPADPEAGPDNPDCIRPASGGNPDLRPIESNNFDASLEWYFSRSGGVTVGVFRKDLNGFINNFTTDITDPEFERLRVTRPQNGGAGRINGVEAAARTFFRASWLPEWMADFGAMVNYTYLDHSTELAPSLAETLPGKQRIAGVSDHLLNVAGFYDAEWGSARLSYNYRSDFVVNYGRVVDPALGAGVLGPTLPVTERGRGTMDFAATLSPTPNFTLTFNATNLLGASVRNHRQFNQEGQVYPWQTRFLESVYRVGLRFRY